MAKQIKRSDVFEGKFFDETINDAKKAIEVFDALDVKINAVASSYKNTLQNANLSTKKGIEDIVKKETAPSSGVWYTSFFVDAAIETLGGNSDLVVNGGQRSFQHNVVLTIPFVTLSSSL